MLTAQEVFDTVVAHLRKQGCKSTLGQDYIGRGICRYRGANGLKCAAGVMIPDEMYSPDMEGVGATRNMVLAALYPGSLRLLSSLQSVHDLVEVSEWEDGFARTASVYGLTCVSKT